jgi:anti-anti-sigma factor
VRLALTEYSAGGLARRDPAGFAGRDTDRTVVLLRGEHDASTVAALSEDMARAIALDDADLVVDLSGVEFMDAATVRLFIRAREFLALRSRSLTLRSPSRRTRRFLDACGIDDHLDRQPVGAARMTSGVSTLALADDSTSVPSGNRATD